MTRLKQKETGEHRGGEDAKEVMLCCTATGKWKKTLQQEREGMKGQWTRRGKVKEYMSREER